MPNVTVKRTQFVRQTKAAFLAVVALALFLLFGYPLREMMAPRASRQEMFIDLHQYSNAHGHEALLIPSDELLSLMSEKYLTLQYWRYVNTLQVLCKQPMRHGSLRDGGKEICIDKEFIPNKPCLVYSFGSALKFDFEESVLRAHGCEVHTFDPSIPINGTNEKKILNRVNYHEIGLGERDFVNQRGWTIQTLPSIIKALGHENRVIDILKIDINGSEWSTFQNASNLEPLESVKQLCLELHFDVITDKQQAEWKNETGRFSKMQNLQILRSLYERGFRIFMRDRNMASATDLAYVYGKQLCYSNELSLINMKWKA